MRFGVLVAPIPIGWRAGWRRGDLSAASHQDVIARGRDGIHNPFAAEAHMTIQSLWTGPIVAGKDGARLSFWRCVVAAIAEVRQKKADAVVKEFLQRRAENQDRNKRWAPTPSRHGTR